MKTFRSETKFKSYFLAACLVFSYEKKSYDKIKLKNIFYLIYFLKSNLNKKKIHLHLFFNLRLCKKFNFSF